MRGLEPDGRARRRMDERVFDEDAPDLKRPFRVARHLRRAVPSNGELVAGRAGDGAKLIRQHRGKRVEVETLALDSQAPCIEP